MSEIQVGDTVRVLTAYYASYDGVKRGDLVTIDEVDDSGLPYRAHGTFWFKPGEIEKVEQGVDVEKDEVATEKPFARFDDEYVDDEDTFNALVSLGVTVTREQYAAALEIAVILNNTRKGHNG